jgi:hypothetical protein
MSLQAWQSPAKNTDDVVDDYESPTTSLLAR